MVQRYERALVLGDCILERQIYLLSLFLLLVLAPGRVHLLAGRKEIRLAGLITTQKRVKTYALSLFPSIFWPSSRSSASSINPMCPRSVPSSSSIRASCSWRL